MKDYQAKNIRNLSVVGHGSEGKTTLVEALLFTAGAIDRQGRGDGNLTANLFGIVVRRGGAVLDADADENHTAQH